MTVERELDTGLSCLDFRGAWFDVVGALVTGDRLDVKKSTAVACHATDCTDADCKALASVSYRQIKGIGTLEELKVLAQDLTAPKLEPLDFPDSLMERVVPISSLVGRREELDQKAA